MPFEQTVSALIQTELADSQVAATASRRSAAEYRPAIDGLRAVAVLAVFIFHLHRAWLRGGFVGVDIFFVISGYLITLILLREYQNETFSLAKFYQRRIARLFPAFYTVAIASLVGAYFIYSPQDLASCGANLAAAVLSVVNLKLLKQGNYFTLSPDAQPFLHCWSLAVEEQFYMLFPLTLLIIWRKARRHTNLALMALCGISFLACVLVTRRMPTYAFFLLPTRAWELLAGAILANRSRNPEAAPDPRWNSMAVTGLVLIAASFFVVKEGDAFPGYIAALPVLGAVFLIAPGRGSTGPAEKLLSWSPLVLIGRMSYSLYLWHWPIFSLVDYKLYMSSAVTRIALKIVLTALTTTLCFFVIENPARVYLNQPRTRKIAFAFLALGLLVFVPLGILIQRTNYIDAGVRDLANGGLQFNPSSTRGTLVLMGDSQGSMYGKITRELADQLGLKLIVLSASGQDSLINPPNADQLLWNESLNIVKNQKPDFLLLAYNWELRLEHGDEGRLATALDQLKPYSKCIILLTQPPELPDGASRESIRNGARPPFIEPAQIRAARIRANALLKGLARKDVFVIDIAPRFETSDGAILFADPQGHLYFHDADHLSGWGAELVKPDLMKVILGAEPDLAR
jgi:peptidoglycan/LPS O-acetylase OafA/YrhL